MSDEKVVSLFGGPIPQNLTAQPRFIACVYNEEFDRYVVYAGDKTTNMEAYMMAGIAQDMIMADIRGIK